MPFFGELFVVSAQKKCLQSFTFFKPSFYKNLTVNTNATPHKRIQHSKIHTARFVFNNFQLQTFFNFKLALNLKGLAKNHFLDLFSLFMYVIFISLALICSTKPWMTMATFLNSWGQTFVLSELKSSTWRWSFHNWVTGLTFFLLLRIDWVI